MLAEAAWQLGLGALLGWAALPLLVRLARLSRHAPPAAYYRALVAALGIAAALTLAPALRGLSGAAFELPLSLAAQPWADAPPMLLVADWVRPIVGSRTQPWASMPLAHGLSVIGGLWLCVLLLGAARAFAGAWRLGHTYRDAASAPARVLSRATQIAAELDIAPPAIRIDGRAASPFTLGLFSPIVVLGPHAASASDDELDFMLRHELMHVRRGDSRTAFWIELTKRCLTGHPCLRALEAEIRFAREAAVDEAAAGPQALEYARFLLGLAERVESLRAPQASLVSMADTALERRIEMLMSKKQRKRAGLGVAGLGAAGLVLGALVFLAPSSFGQSDAGSAANETQVTGNLSVEQVKRVVFGHPRPLLDCYSQLPEPRANLGVRLQFEITENGTVAPERHVEVAGHPELAQCFEASLGQYVFPPPSSGTVKVDMPSELSPPYNERTAYAEATQGVSQRLDPEVIRKGVRDHYDQFRTCYEALGEPLPETRATLKFTIARDGKVSDGEVESKEYPALGRCFDGVMRSMVFPAPKDGIVTVVYPILVAPGEPEASQAAP